MRPAFAQFHREHMNRRDAIKLGATGAAAAVAAATVGAKSAAAQGNSNSQGQGNGNSNGVGNGGRYGPPSGSFSDEMFDVEAVLAGAWDVGPYGPGDQRGTFNELTPRTDCRRSALAQR